MSEKKATTILAQIPAGVRMSLGAREFVGDEHTGYLHFKVGPSRPTFKVCIQLTANDDYQVRLVKLGRHGLDVTTLEEAHSIHADQLGELLLRWEGKHLVG
jgi:hypothetical protein